MELGAKSAALGVFVSAVILISSLAWNNAFDHLTSSYKQSGQAKFIYAIATTFIAAFLVLKYRDLKGFKEIIP